MTKPTKPTKPTGQISCEKGYATELLDIEGVSLHRLTLPPPAPGFEDFITPWLLKTRHGTLLVDPGPAATIPCLAELLKDQGVDELDLVLLTHIHIDHSGGIADLISLFPGAKVVSHPRSFRHLTDPARLWESSQKVLGDLANRYGPIKPLPEDALLQDLPGPIPGLEVIATPGHSSHHQSYVFTNQDMKILFAGEAAGVYLGGSYIRPATPPRFFFDVAYGSLQKLMAVGPTATCYGHFGFTHNPGWLNKAAEQLVLWREALAELIDTKPDVAVEQALTYLEQKDPYLKGRHRFGGQIASRERYFIQNSIKGFLQALKEGT